MEMQSTNHSSLGIHCLGNGRLCAYEQGPNILQVFGPPYSSPMLGSLMLDADASVRAESRREPGAAIWTHQLFAGDAPFAELTDFVDADLPCLVRRIRSSAPVNLRLTLGLACTAVDNSRLLSHGAGGLLCEVAAGTPFYSRYPYPRSVVYQIAWRGDVNHRAQSDGATLTFGPGESWLYIAGGPEYPQTVEHAATALSLSGNDLLARTRASWQTFTQSRGDGSARLPAQIPHGERLLQAIDDVCVLIKAQQSVEGGVLAGHNYHLCYVRDQYGVSRGLLAAGHAAAAKAILEFYWHIWQRNGRIHNAQAAGVDGAFHIHENDEVEITGYLIRQAFDLQTAMSDAEFTAEIFPMLAWAYEAQKRHVIDGMLPFNGDETYVAGGILPRSALNDGSAEATLLFIDSGERLVEYATHNHRWPQGKSGAERELLAQVKAAYRSHFWFDGQLVTNQPARANLPGAAPRFRHGVCERCMAEGRFRFIEWTEHSASGRYLCPACLAQGDYDPVAPRIYTLQSVSLTPLYFRSDLFRAAELRPLVENIVTSYQRTGQLPSRPDDARRISVGYDYGFLLYALTELNHPAATALAGRTLDLLDSTGAWVEYYIDHQPAGTRCRPWESAINLEALLRWAGW